jgi:hypothetical protein
MPLVVDLDIFLKEIDIKMFESVSFGARQHHCCSSISPGSLRPLEIFALCLQQACARFPNLSMVDGESDSVEVFAS